MRFTNTQQVIDANIEGRSEEFNGILAYQNPHTKEVLLTYVRRGCPFVGRNIETLKGQGVTNIGFWHLENWHRSGKAQVEKW